MTIEDMVATLKPVRPLLSLQLWGLGLVVLLLSTAWVLSVYGLRADLQVISKLMPIIKPLILLCVAMLALSAVTHMARPEGQVPLWVSGGLWAIVALLIIGAVWDSVASGRAFLSPLSEPFIRCWIVTLIGGSAGYAVLWGLWLRRAAPSDPVAFGAMTALAISGLTAAAYTLYCDRDMPLYILVYYGTPLLIMTAVGALVGRWLYKW